MKIAIRHYDSIGDEAFLLSTWMKSFRDSGVVRAVPTPVYNIGQRTRIMKLMRQPDTKILVACDDDTPEFVYGYMVYGSNNTVHYLYTKGQYRKYGIAKELLRELDSTQPVFYTHKSPEIWLERKLKDDANLQNYIFNPYLLEQ